nr:hypothetical protein [Cressdnaviricota sp.]
MYLQSMIESLDPLSPLDLMKVDKPSSHAVRSRRFFSSVMSSKFPCSSMPVANMSSHVVLKIVAKMPLDFLLSLVKPSRSDIVHSRKAEVVGRQVMHRNGVCSLLYSFSACVSGGLGSRKGFINWVIGRWLKLGSRYLKVTLDTPSRRLMSWIPPAGGLCLGYPHPEGLGFSNDYVIGYLRV